jgi:hypothetical protein
MELVRSQMRGDFNLADASLNLSNLHYDIPGASIKLAGIYSLDGAKFNFAGTADMQATVSRMVGGWKAAAAADAEVPFKIDRPSLRSLSMKNGAGTEIPFKIDGTRSDPHAFGLGLRSSEGEGPWLASTSPVIPAVAGKCCKRPRTPNPTMPTAHKSAPPAHLRMKLRIENQPSPPQPKIHRRWQCNPSLHPSQCSAGRHRE